MSQSGMVQALILKGMMEAALKEYWKMWGFPVDNKVKKE